MKVNYEHPQKYASYQMLTASTTIIKPKLSLYAHTQALEYISEKFAKMKTKKFHAYLSPSVSSSPSSVVNEILREDRWAFHVSDMVGRELTFRKIVQFSCNREERSVYKAHHQAPGYIHCIQCTSSWLCTKIEQLSPVN